MILKIIIIIISLLWLPIECIEDLIRNQSVDCESDRIVVNLEFVEPFNGFAYIDESYDKEWCKWEGKLTKNLNISVPTNAIYESKPNGSKTCVTTYEKSTGELTATLIISPVKSILVDGAIKLQARCVYFLNDVTVTMSRLYIQRMVQASGLVTGTSETPTFLLQIIDGHGIKGHAITQAFVGQNLTLDLILKDTAIYDFFVYSCFAHDGSNSADARIQIIDANGCGVKLERAIDVPVNVLKTNNGGLKHVYMHMYGFQFTSSQYVHFECQVRPCINSCTRQQCDRSVGNGGDESGKRQSNRRHRDIDETQDLKLLTVLRMIPQPTYTSELHKKSQEIFNSTIAIGSLLVVTSIVLFILLFFYQFRMRRRNYTLSIACDSFYSASPTIFTNRLQQRPKHRYFQ